MDNKTTQAPKPEPTEHLKYLQQSERATLLALAFALACQELEQMSGVPASQWADRIGDDALGAFLDNKISRDQLEDICASVFNRGQKL